MTKSFDAATTALSAIANASRVPASRADLKRLLTSGSGEPSHVRAVFGDLDLSTLMRLLIDFGISDAAFAEAYDKARELHAAANPQLDRLLIGPEFARSP